MSGQHEAVIAAQGHEKVLGVGAALWRRKFWILIPTLIAFGLSLAFVTLSRPRYSGEARVLLENRETAYSRADRDQRAQDPMIDAEAVASQVQNIMSRDLALKVVKEMGLANNPEFDPLARGAGVADKVLALLGLGVDPSKYNADDRAVQTFQKRLTVFPQGKSRVITIEFQSEDPTLAADIANRIAAEYMLREEGAKSSTSKSSSEWLDRAIEPLVQKVQAAEAKVEAFRASKGLFLGSGSTTISTQQLSELNTQMSAARSAQAELQAKARLIREALRLGRIFETSEVNNNELVRRLLEQRAGLKAQIALEERTLLPGHPRMRELGAQLADLEMQVRAAAERAARALENDARVSGARVATMQAEIDSQKKTAALSNEDEVQLKALERDANVLREQLNSYRSKFLDAAARAGESAHPADARIISRAFPAVEPTFPKKVPIVLLATLGTFLLCCTLVATNALMARASLAPAEVAPGYVDPYGYGPVPAPVVFAPGAQGEVQREAMAPALHAVPEPQERHDEGKKGSFPFGLGRRVAPKTVASVAPAVAAGADDALAGPETTYQPAEDLAREVAMMGGHGHGKVIMVYALEAEPRLSLSTLRFARRFARDGAAVVLDLLGQGTERDGGNLYTRLLPPGTAGLNAYLDRVSPLGDIIHRDSRTQLHVIASGGPAFQRLAAASMRDQVSGLIEALRRSYSHVVIDGGTVGGSGELFAHHADVIVLLSRRPETDDFLMRAVEKFESLRDSPVFVMSEAEASTAASGPRALAVFERA